MMGKTQTEKHIVYARHHGCCDSFDNDVHYWKLIEHSSPLEAGSRYQADCDYLGGGSWCDDCGEWIEKVEKYSPQRAKELGLEASLPDNLADSGLKGSNL